MEQTIWKYELETTDEQTIKIPYGGQIISIQIQNGKPCMWVLVHPKNEHIQDRNLEIYGTGHPVKDIEGTQLYHRGTYKLIDKGLVFHVFERI